MNLIIVFLLLAIYSNADCPLNHYPRLTVNGFIEAQINNSRENGLAIHDFTYTFETILAATGIQVAISIVGLQLTLNDNLNFKVLNIPLTQYDKLTFRVTIDDPNYLWRSLKWMFFATQEAQFSVYMEREIDKFSIGLEEGSYSVYRVLQEFQKFSQEPVVKVFLSGIEASFKQGNNSEIIAMQNQLFSMKAFGGNKNIIKLIQEALQIEKGIFFNIENAKNIGKIVGFNIKTNLVLKSLSFSYILFSKMSISEQHNIIDGNFYLVDDRQHKFSILNNMQMLITGLTQLSMPYEQLYSFSINYQQKFNQGYFSLESNKPHFKLGFTYVAFQMKRQFVCSDCLYSPHIYQNRFCVSECPRSYSVIQKQKNTYCEKCQIQSLKVVDPYTNQCVCANRHYLNLELDQCQPCRYDCLTCSSNNRCLTCDNDNMETKRVMNEQGRCVCPLTSFYDNQILQDIVCQKCDSSCRTCNGPRKHDCLTCNTGKILDVLGFCICSKGYEEAHDGTCYCPSPKVLLDGICILNSTECSPQKEPQFVDLTRRCICKQQYTQVLGQCIKCQDNSIFDNDTLSCKCSNKTVYFDGKCIGCGQNKVYNQYLGICECSKNTFKTDDGKCISCPKGMGFINNQCQCPFNYFQKNKACVRCTDEADGPLCRKNFSG